MNKLLPQFEHVKLWQALLLATFSVLLTWVATIYAVAEYVQKTGSNISELGGLSQVAINTFDSTVIIFGFGVFIVSGIGCLILLSIFNGLRVFPVAQAVWASLTLLGVVLAKVFS